MQVEKTHFAQHFSLGYVLNVLLKCLLSQPQRSYKKVSYVLEKKCFTDCGHGTLGPCRFASPYYNK